jgi:hypothetical protein
LKFIPGDDALRQAAFSNVSMIKIDIEGDEKSAFQGAHHILMASGPIVVFELTLSQNSPVEFNGRQDLLAVLPPDYKFFAFNKPYANSTGAYKLIELDRRVRFDLESQYDLVAYPVEKARLLPKSSAP